MLYVVIAALLLFAALSFFPKWRGNLKKNIEMVIFALASGVFSRFIIAEIIRFFYNRPRPFEVLDNVKQLVERSGWGSFPSGHASFSFAIAMAVAYYYPKTSILFFLAAFSIGGGRVAAGAHWPSDILAGAVVGILSAWLVKILLKNFARGGS